MRRELVDWAKGHWVRSERAGRRSTSVVQTRFDGAFARVPSRLELNGSNVAGSRGPLHEYEDRVPGRRRADDSADRSECIRGRAAATCVGRTADCITATSRRNDDGMVVIDQHALHERILYEQLARESAARPLESQPLLVPEPVDLTRPSAAAVLEPSDLLAQLGVAVEPFGGDTVLVSSYPAMLANFSPAEVSARSGRAMLLAGGKSPERRDLLDELLHMISCKAAIKAGDRLSREEIAALLEQRHLAQDQHHCPHGRPTALVFTREELDKQFKRT